MVARPVCSRVDARCCGAAPRGQALRLWALPRTGQHDVHDSHPYDLPLWSGLPASKRVRPASARCKSSGCGVGRGRSGIHTRTLAWHEPATNLPTSGTRRRGETAGFKSLDTGLPRRLAHAIELCWGLEAHPHPDNQLSARGLEPRECGNKGVQNQSARCFFAVVFPWVCGCSVGAVPAVPARVGSCSVGADPAILGQ